MIDFYRSEKSRAFTYTRIGENHILSGQDNQDNVVFERMQNAWYMVIADGVSSADCAQEGSKAAVQVIRDLCDKLSSDILLIHSFDDIKVDLVRRWKNKIESNWDDYATTLNFAIYVKDSLLLGQIGDGLIVADVTEEPVIMSEQEEFYTTETEALATKVRKSSILLKVIDNISKGRLYMTSDGIGKEISEDSRTGLLEYLDKMIANDDTTIEEELDSWVCGLGRKNGDDKSIGFILWEG